MKRDVHLLTQIVTDKTQKFKERMFETETNTEEMEKKMNKLKNVLSTWATDEDSAERAKRPTAVL